MKLAAGAGAGLPFVGMLPCECRHPAPNEQRPCWKRRHTGADDMAPRESRVAVEVEVEVEGQRSWRTAHCKS